MRLPIGHKVNYCCKQRLTAVYLFCFIISAVLIFFPSCGRSGPGFYRQDTGKARSPLPPAADKSLSRNIRVQISIYKNNELLDRFSKDSVLFTNAYSTSPWTLPAHISLFTGLNEYNHGVKKDIPLQSNQKNQK